MTAAGSYGKRGSPRNDPYRGERQQGQHRLYAAAIGQSVPHCSLVRYVVYDYVVLVALAADRSGRRKPARCRANRSATGSQCAHQSPTSLAARGRWGRTQSCGRRPRRPVRARTWLILWARSGSWRTRADLEVRPAWRKAESGVWRSSDDVRCWMDQIRNGEPRRNAMQQFVAKFEKDIHGVMSGFDRVLFRGSLRRLTHSLGMKWYLSQNDILCKQYEDHVKQISQKVKQAALAPFKQQNLLVQHVYGGDDK